MLAAIISAAIGLPARVRMWGGALLALLVAGAIFAAKWRAAGAETYRRRAAEARARSIKNATEVRNEIRNESDASLDDRLDKWMRD